MPPTERFIAVTNDGHEAKYMTYNTEEAAVNQAMEWAHEDLNEPVYICKITAAYNVEEAKPILTCFPE